MAINPFTPFEGDLSTGYIVQPSDWNGMFDAITTYFNSVIVPAINNLIGSVAGVPAGLCAPMWWTQAVPAGWALCNGQTVNWLTGPLAGNAVVTPNMIGMVVQGSDITGGVSTVNPNGWAASLTGQVNQATVGNINHSHPVSIGVSVFGTTGTALGSNLFSAASGGSVTTPSHQHQVTSTGTASGSTNNGEAQSPSICMPWIMKL